MIKQRHSIKKVRGQAMVEFALTIPLLLLFVVAIIYFGRLFYVKQIVIMAAQEGVRFSSRIPNLNDSSNRDFVRGFTPDGAATNPDSPIYRALAAGHLLTGPQGESGNLPPGSLVEVLPWDGDFASLPPGLVSVKITYPFTFLGNGQTNSNFGNSIDIWTGPGGSPISFANIQISEQAVASQEVF